MYYHVFVQVLAHCARSKNTRGGIANIAKHLKLLRQKRLLDGGETERCVLEFAVTVFRISKGLMILL
jgi:hypothetical protein